MRRKQRQNTVRILNPEPNGKTHTSPKAALSLERRGHLEFTNASQTEALITERGIQARYGNRLPSDDNGHFFHWRSKPSGDSQTGYFSTMQAKQGKMA